MSFAQYRKTTGFLARSAICAPLLLTPANATDLTAGVIMEKMDATERNAFLAGVVEGLAYARYAKDGKNTDGMKCIYDWFYEKDGTRAKIHAAFERFHDYLPGAVLAAMVEKECGT